MRRFPRADWPIVLEELRHVFLSGDELRCRYAGLAADPAVEMTLRENGDLWRDIRTSQPAGNHPALFLDRDGTLTELVDYLTDRSGCTNGWCSGISGMNKDGHAVVIVTNQSGIGRGYYRWDDFHAVQARL